MSDIFISYKREEQKVAKRLATALERHGWLVWWDPKLRAGEHFDDVIEAALQESRCVIVLWSKHSVKSRYVKDEATYALQRDKLVPVLIEDTEVPFRFEGLQTPRLIGWNGSVDDAGFLSLVDDITSKVGEPSKEIIDVLSKLKVDATTRVEQENRRKEEEEHIESGEAATVKRNPLLLTIAGIAAFLFVVTGVYLFNTNQTLKNIELIDDVLPEMVSIPSGSFTMGCVSGKNCDEDEQPTHIVTVPAFEMSKYEVTFRQWDVCHADGGCTHNPDDEGWGRDDRPVINVSWDDVQQYAKWLSRRTGDHYRLPSEAEWEYAVRAGTTTPHPMQGKGYRYSAGFTVPVGELEYVDFNRFGLHVMNHNVSEWTRDCYRNNYTGAPSDGSAWESRRCSRRVFRGGSWSYDPPAIRSAARNSERPDYRNNDLGFRLARTL